jgi:hypothetical protein
MFILIYGADGSGKSVQAMHIAEAAESAEHWSFATKNRRLYQEAGVPSVELLRFNPDSTVNPYNTIDAFHAKVAETVKSNLPHLIIIDEITLLRKWAQPVVIEEINKQRRAYQKPPITKIGENNYAAWARVNDIVYGKLELLANWSEMHDAVIVAITSIAENRRLVVDESGETKSVTTGEWVVDAKENVRKLADIRVRLDRDGRKGKGYWAYFEKCQDWMTEGKEEVKVGKDGLMIELTTRGVL